MTTPSGLLMWGQAGNYDAVEDRSVLAVLAQGRTGLVFAPALTALPGLVVGVGPWGGVVDCEDRTVAVIGSRDTQSIGIDAGGAAPRRDVIWADIDTDAGTWEAHVYPEGSTTGRAGLLLGTVVVPAGANNSSVMDLIPARPGRWGGTADPATFNPGGNVNGTGWTTIHAATIPGGDAAEGSVYEGEVWGNGTNGQADNSGAQRHNLNLRVRIGGTQMVITQVSSSAFANNQNAFRFRIKYRAIRLATAWQSYMEYSFAVFGGANGTNPNHSTGNTIAGMICESTGSSPIDPANDLTFDVQGQWTGTGANPTMIGRVGTFRKTAG